MANPYLAFAVTLAAALDGIRTGEEPPEPLDEGLVIYDDAELQRRGLAGFIVPRADEHQGEYVSPRAERLAWLTAFLCRLVVHPGDERGVLIAE